MTKRLKIDDWVFDVDIPATLEYSHNELQENCQCVYCRNYYNTVDLHFPALREFLGCFGVHIFAPDSLIPYDYEDSVECSLMYKVYGSFERAGNKPIQINSLQITAELNDETSFYLTFSVVLPWTLSNQK